MPWTSAASLGSGVGDVIAETLGRRPPGRVEEDGTARPAVRRHRAATQRQAARVFPLPQGAINIALAGTRSARRTPPGIHSSERPAPGSVPSILGLDDRPHDLRLVQPRGGSNASAIHRRMWSRGSPVSPDSSCVRKRADPAESAAINADRTARSIRRRFEAWSSSISSSEPLRVVLTARPRSVVVDCRVRPGSLDGPVPRHPFRQRRRDPVAFASEVSCSRILG